MTTIAEEKARWKAIEDEETSPKGPWASEIAMRMLITANEMLACGRATVRLSDRLGPDEVGDVRMLAARMAVLQNHWGDIMVKLTEIEGGSE